MIIGFVVDSGCRFSGQIKQYLLSDIKKIIKPKVFVYNTSILVTIINVI